MNKRRQTDVSDVTAIVIIHLSPIRTEFRRYGCHGGSFVLSRALHEGMEDLWGDVARVCNRTWGLEKNTLKSDWKWFHAKYSGNKRA